MSRAINVSLSVAEIESLCAKHDCRISTVEALLSGGSRVVLLDGRDAEKIRGLLKNKVIVGRITRSAQHVSRQPPPSYR